jgi:hypothetical protein
MMKHNNKQYFMKNITVAIIVIVLMVSYTDAGGQVTHL